MKFNIYLALSILMLSACSSGTEEEKSDVEVPVITLQSSNPDYTTGDICGSEEEFVFPLLSEQTLNLDLLFTDDVELSQYKIDIHHNFDCHAHGRVKEVGEPWFVTRIEKLENHQQAVNEKLTVPANVTAGNYHLLIYCLDKVGNEAEPLVFSMKIQNRNDTESPILSISSPPSSGFTVDRGDSFSFEGSISDNHTLSGGRIELFYYDPTNTLFTVNRYFFPEETGNDYDFSIPYQVDATAEPGAYKYHVKVYDRYNNPAEKIIPVIVQ